MSSSLWRWPAAAGLATTAGVHISLVPEHLQEAPYAAVLFLLLSAAALAVAGVLAVQDHWAAWACAGALSAAALCAYVLSRSLGLPSLADDVGDWFNGLGVTAIACESTVALLSVAVLSRRGRVAVPRQAKFA